MTPSPPGDPERARRLAEVRARIERAFEAVPHPARGQVAGGPPEDLERREMEERLGAESWQTVIRSTLAWSPMNLLTAQGFCYFLPAYLLAALEHGDDELPVDVIATLTLFDPTEWPGEEEDFRASNRWRIDRYNQLTSAQRGAVLACLEYLRDYPTYEPLAREAATALDRHWAAQAG